MLETIAIGTAGHLVSWGAVRLCAGENKLGFGMPCAQPRVRSAIAVQYLDHRRSVAEHNP